MPCRQDGTPAGDGEEEGPYDDVSRPSLPPPRPPVRARVLSVGIVLASEKTGGDSGGWPLPSFRPAARTAAHMIINQKIGPVALGSVRAGAALPGQRYQTLRSQVEEPKDLVGRRLDVLVSVVYARGIDSRWRPLDSRAAPHRAHAIRRSRAPARPRKSTDTDTCQCIHTHSCMHPARNRQRFFWQRVESSG